MRHDLLRADLDDARRVAAVAVAHNAAGLALVDAELEGVDHDDEGDCCFVHKMARALGRDT
jgi:hypothetical protein